MNVEMITMDPGAAREAYRAYRGAVKTSTDARRNAEDELAMKAFLAAGRGRQILDLHQAMKTAGLFESGFPKLAICRADYERCRVDMKWDGGAHFFRDGDSSPSWDRRYRRKATILPLGTFPRAKRQRDEAIALVPSIPPSLRPKHGLRNYHILWEAVWEPAPPVDPLLLKHLGGALYAVLAAWDLSLIEQAVLRGRLA